MKNLSPSKRGCRSTSFHEIKFQGADVGFPGRSRILTFMSGIPGLVAGSPFHIDTKNCSENTVLYIEGLSVQWKQLWRSWTVFHGTCHKRMAPNHAGVKVSVWCKVHKFVCPSSIKTSKFTDEMALVGGARCGCLPDCEDTDYQYSLTSSKLRWVFYLGSFQISSGRAIPETLTCTLCVPWKMDRFRNCGWTK